MKPSLREFVEEVMKIQPAMAGLGGASSAIAGTTGTEGVAGEKLRQDVLAFAQEYSRPTGDRERLLELAQAVEGSLLTVKMVSGISDEKLERLIAELHGFLR